MIKCDKGVVVVSGSTSTILVELAGIIESVHKKPDRCVRQGSGR